MPWTDFTRHDYAREAARYASDLSDREWALIAPLLPGPKPVGRPRVANLREVVNAILYMASTGCQWRMLPRDFPPFTTVQDYFYAWRDIGVLRAINNTLVMEARELEGREASPSAGVIDSQSVKTTESGGIRGFDAGKKINGRWSAPYCDRHQRVAGRSRRPQRRGSGSRRCGTGAQVHREALAVAAPCLRRRRLCGPEAEGCAEEDRPFRA